ncbi:hypothetical protein MTR67_011220 [Solanum verrucosum]|uniref:Uncharacterized protein n=1 Tax=Solanum verrucosum TaxID=315347 RepID=A0AAF0QAL1_SOLVR|nr:hypothetical protein MTR67_011220 [Solanum verrucosum]
MLVWHNFMFYVVIFFPALPVHVTDLCYIRVFSCFMLSVETHDVCNTVYTDSGYVMVVDILYGSRSVSI